MAVRYSVVIKDRAGVKKAEVPDFLLLGYRKEVNAPGWFMFEVPTGHRCLQHLEYDGQIEIWRANAESGIDFYCDFYGLYIDQEPYQNELGVDFIRVHGFGQMDFLRRAIVAYAAGVDGRSEFTSDPAETIMKNLATYNATSSGTTGDGRDRNVDTWGSYVSVEADGAGGNALDFVCARQELHQALQELALIGGGDFDLVKDGAQSWEFRWYSGQLGTDRSSTVIFSPGNNNMLIPRIVPTRLSEKTVAIVGGRGEESDRTIVVRTGDNYQATYGSSEFFVPAVQYTTTEGLEGAGDKQLEVYRAKQTIEFTVLQTENTLYGLHYFVGDLVTGVYRDVSATKKVEWAQVMISEDESELENVEIGLGDV